MSTESTTRTLDTSAFTAAIVARDAEGVSRWYAEDATLTVVDRDHPPAAPQVYAGLGAITAYYRDLCGRNIDHRIERLVSDDAGFAFVQQCRYPDGAGVTCSTLAEVRDGRIHEQTAVQAWDA
jgi:ketosteroid isomerase-like protein